MIMKRKLAALAVALLASVGMVAVAAPVSAAVPQVCHTLVADDNTIESQVCVPAKDKAVELARWGYCSPATTANRVMFWDNQGYCGSSVAMNAPTSTQCRYMGQWDNWAGSAYNLTNDVVLWAGSNCNTIPFLTLQNGYAHPDLYATSLGNAVSAISLTGGGGCPSCRKIS